MAAELLLFGGFKMAAIHHLASLKFTQHFNCQHGSEGQFISPCQILYRLVEPFLKYVHLIVFTWKMADKKLCVHVYKSQVLSI